MKTFILILSLIFPLVSQAALTRQQIETLLNQKNMTLMQLEQRGAQVLLGEVTGHGRAVPFNKVQVLFTESEAILKHEIDSVEFKGGAEQLGNISTVRFQGQYVLKQDVKAAIVLGR
jgi:hypothetical protein